MKQITALNNLEEGQYANVVSLSSCGTIRRRLQDLGAYRWHQSRVCSKESVRRSYSLSHTRCSHRS